MKTEKEIKAEANDIADEFAISINDKCLQIAESIPETDGTLLQRKMMAALLLEGSEGWTVTRLCNVAGCSRNEWYRVTQRAEFGEKIAKLQKQAKGIYVPAVFRAFIKKALYGDKDGFGNASNQQALLRDLEIFRGDSGGSGGKSGNTVNVVVNQDAITTKTEDELIEGAIQELESRGYRVIRPNNRIKCQESPA